MEELLTVARSLPSRDGADVDRYLQALATADDALAEAIGDKLRTTLVVRTRVELVPWGTLQRSEYKSKLVEHEPTR